MIFIDTSAFYALFDRSDSHHEAAAQAWSTLRENPDDLTTSNYVLVETTALLQARLGLPAVQDFVMLTSRMSILWINAEQHKLATTALLTAGRRTLSLVDCTSFSLMRSTGIRTAFTFDPHFAEQGFHCLP